jgi:hypothetical protein
MRLNEVKWLSAVLGMASLAFFVGTVFCAPAQAASSYTLVPAEYGMQLKTPDGRVVFEYVTKRPEDIGLTAPSAAYFNPVNTPSGIRVSNVAPNDHPHHRGIFMGWQNSEFREPSDLSNYGPHAPVKALRITRADFWAWGQYAPREDRVIATREVKLVNADAQHAQLAIHNDWMVYDRKMVDEVIDANVTERDGVYVLDLVYHLTPVADFYLYQSGFGGFDFQARKDGDSYFATAKGKVNLPDPSYTYPESNWPAEPWYDYTIHLKDGKTVGAAVIDHPKNPPSTWQNSSHLWMLNPSITGPGPVTIKKDTTLTLQYRVVVHDGETPTATIEKLAAEWRHH